jgi:histidinol dehydrogenase
MRAQRQGVPVAELIRRLDTTESRFAERLDALVHWDVSDDDAVNRSVRGILDDVRLRGDAALLEYTARFDRLALDDAAALEIPAAELAASLEGLDAESREALQEAAARIRRFHEQQLQPSWEIVDEYGNGLGSRVTPLDRVGVYVPGGQAAYPSTVLMTVVPARVAGVGEVVVTVPTPAGERNALVLAAMHVAGVDRVFAIGGAQAIAALAYGTATVPRVDKIVGPGGAYVAAAKRLVFGPVGIDVIAGPSEILIIADGSTPIDWVVLDLFSQAEHDEAAQAILLCPDTGYLDAVHRRIGEMLPQMARSELIARSLTRRGALIRTRDLAEAVAVANRIAPEHLELAVADPDALLSAVRHAGAIFVGPYSAEAVGDYAAGPSHVLPTFGTARFASPLGVYDFQKRSSIIRCTATGAEPLSRLAAILARGEGLDAHARAATARIRGFDHNDTG